MLKCTGCGEENPPRFKLCGYCGTPLPQAPAALPVHEVRKTVTLIFCDLKGSTALGEQLDPEALHEVKELYFRSMAEQITRHGGRIEKYIGDAIMAVFGLPHTREDDALRAVRAALDMRTALEQVNRDLRSRYGVTLTNRTGVNTGEVVANDDPGADQKLATGDAVNIAARLEQAAPDNQIYLGDLTWRLVRDAVVVEAVEPLELKGKAQRVPAWRLVSADGLDGNLRRHDTQLVGRDAELATLRQALDEASSSRQLRMVTVLADAGVGKSRLVREFIDSSASQVRVLSGRCLAYGHGITFWPLMLMLREAAGIVDGDSAVVAHTKLTQAVGEPAVAERLASIAGLSATPFALPEINWAARKFFEHLAAERALIVFVDDIHWAEPAFLDLLEQVLQSGAQAPVLLLATSRPELLEQRPDWGSQPGARRIVLPSLDDVQTAQVVANLLGARGVPEAMVRQVVQAAEGNPLYVEQMLSMLIDSGALQHNGARDGWAWRGGAIGVPPTIHALLEARLDRLARAERATVEPGAVAGLEFPRAAVQALVPQTLRPTMDEQLQSLARKQFIRPSGADGEPHFRFHHHLVRDTVYNGLLKRERAQLHLAFVRWADGVNAERERDLEFEQILGYHLEQAYQCLRELGPLDAQGTAIGIDGARRLGNAARRAAARGDTSAAVNVYRRAIALLADDDPARRALLPELGEALIGLGDFAAAKAMLDEAHDSAERTGDTRVRAASQLGGMLVRLYSGEHQSSWGEEALRTAQALIPALEDEDAHNEIATAWRLVVLVHGIAGRYSLAGEAVARSMAYARRAGNQRLVWRNALLLAINALQGPTPVAQAIAQCESLLAEGLGDRQVECNVMCALAQLKAMNGELDAARLLYRRSRALLHDLGQGVYAASTGIDLARVELHGGDLALAEREVRSDVDFLAAKGETYFLSTMAALLSRIVRDQGRDDEALALSKTAEAATADDDVEAQALWRSIRAPILARAGDLAQAEQLARSAVELARRTEAPMLQADTLNELAQVLTLAGQDDAACAVRAEANQLCAAKGNRVAAAQNSL